MFGWLAPRCPLATANKAWAERRMLWLAARFGLDRMRAARVILPTVEFFPDPYYGDEAGARACFDRMCGYLAVPVGSVTLEVLDDDRMPGAAGLYQQRERSHISVARSGLASLPRLLATIAHELAHELLFKGGHLTGDTPDHEQVTDLLPVFLGAGVFLANATVESTSVSDGTYHSWSISRRGYLNSITLGYALALFAFGRGEDRPAWAGYLRADARVTLRNGLRYLRKTGDTLFRPDAVGLPQSTPTPDDLRQRLADRSPTARLAALWDVADCDPPAADLLHAVERCLTDRDADVRCEAVRTLGAFGAAAAAAVPRLTEIAWSGDTAFRVAAAEALGQLTADPAVSVPTLAGLLSDAEPAVAGAAAGSLARFGPIAATAEPQLLAAIESAAAVGQFDRLEHLLVAMRAVGPDARGRLRRHFTGRDPEVLRLALGVLRDQG